MPPARFDNILRLAAQGDLERAKAACLRLAQSTPKDPHPAALLSELCERSNQLPQAAHWAVRAAELSPHNPDSLARAGRLCAMEDQREQAETFLTAALQLRPHDAPSRIQLANLLALQNRFTDMAALVAQGLALDPANAELAGLAAGAQLNLARADRAAALLKDLASRHPDNPGFAAGYALVLNYVPHIPPEEVAAAHRRFGALVPTQPAYTLTNSHDPHRRLRVAVISPDLRAHSVAWFAEPILCHFSPATLELIVYQTNYVADAVTARLRPLASAWHVMDSATDAMLADRLHADAIDIALELSGLTPGHALPALARRPTPLAITYLGYPNTTGTSFIHHRLVDSHTDPVSSNPLATENLLRLDPCFLCYAPPADPPAPLPARTPTSSSHAPVFGSFNSAQKLNDDVIDLWARVLHAVPDSRLVLKAVNFRDPHLRDDIRARFANAGVDPSRLDILAPLKDRNAHLASYNAIDIALDPFPYAGTTTTCEALWMGVPVVTLRGQSHPGRVGVSLLHAVGHPEWIADTHDAYVQLASTLAASIKTIAANRPALRARMLASPLCNAPAFATSFEQALRTAWKSHCTNPR